MEDRTKALIQSGYSLTGAAFTVAMEAKAKFLEALTHNLSAVDHENVKTSIANCDAIIKLTGVIQEDVSGIVEEI